ncbi:MAG: DNA mismatch repair endonuclease MutH [Legionellales bacterium]|nr:DNA mismatch repair endonuclease MutH [Legionellales bacterium]
MLSPHNEQSLLAHAERLAGKNLAQLAALLDVTLPRDLTREKGIVGQLIEKCLGAKAHSQPIPDFPELGIELKTLPIDRHGRVLESTYVCVVQLTELSQITWETSYVRAKLARVLWVPILAERCIPLAERIVGMPLLWSPNRAEEQLLKTDWQELTDLISLGELTRIHGKLGQVLQIRPKAANAKALCRAIGEEGQPILTLPRGFYLRAEFTTQLLAQHYL